MTEPVKVTVSDPATGEVLGERVIDNDYVLICAGRAHQTNVTRHANGTHVITIKGAP